MSGQQIPPPGSPFPGSVIIIGAGIFGLSTAIAIAKRHPNTAVTVVDRMTPPVLDGTSVDTTRCIRADYADPIYARLAKEAQIMLENDPEISQHMFKQGMTFACDGQSGRFTDLWEAQRKLAASLHDPESLVALPSREAVFQRIHGEGSQPPPVQSLAGGRSRWNGAYCNLEDAFIDAGACIQVYYERALKKPSISFRCGSAVDRLQIEHGISKGVVLEDGTELRADLVLVAAGAWSNRLVYLENRIDPIGHEVAWIKVTPEEERRWKNMSITTNLSTGLNMFPPYNGEIKILRRSPGYKNTTRVRHPEDPSKTIEISYPRTSVTNPTDIIPLDAEKAMRENLREIMPPLADRAFARTKICWICTTPTADFLVAPHPRVGGVHLATGGSAHAWKFLPVIGDLVVDSMEGKLSQELAQKWAYAKGMAGSDHNAPRMDGKPEELRDVCDRKHPQCTTCALANVSCEFEMRSGDKELMLQNNDLRARNEALQQRVRCLEEIIDTATPDPATILSGQSVRSCPGARSSPRTSPVASMSQPESLAVPCPPSRRSTTDLAHSLSIPLLRLSHGVYEPQHSGSMESLDDSSRPLDYSSVTDIPELPSVEVALATCKSFLSGHKQTNHVVSEEELVQDLSRVFEPGALRDARLSGSRFRCFMVLYLAQERYWMGRGEPEQKDTSLRELYRRLALKDAVAAVSKADLQSVQALVLLGLMCVQEPEGPDLWQVVGLAARMAVAIGIHRKDEFYLSYVAASFTDEGSLSKHNERRKDIFWAVYSLDRLAMFTLSRPSAIRDHDIDVEMPSQPSGVSSLSKEGLGAASRIHSLKGRRLYGQIQESLYAVSISSDGPLEEREEIINDLRRSVQSWYASSPLKAAFVPISDTTVKRQSLDDLQYNQMIMALHRPSPLMPRISSAFVGVLYEAASISVDLYSHYSHENQVLVNWVHLQQIYTSCATLVYCFWEYQARDDLTEIPQEQIFNKTDQCRRLLARFGPPWPQTQRYQAMFETLTQPFYQQQVQQQQQRADASLFTSTQNLSWHPAPKAMAGASFGEAHTPDVFASKGADGEPADLFEAGQVGPPFLLGQTPGSVMRDFWSESLNLADLV